MNARRLAIEGMIMIAAIAMRLSPLERDLLVAGLSALYYRYRPPDEGGKTVPDCHETVRPAPEPSRQSDGWRHLPPCPATPESVRRHRPA